MDLLQLIEDLIPVVEEASAEVLRIYESQDVAITYKKDDSPLTEADLLVHHKLTEYLSERTPAISIISEESKTHALSKEDRFYWVMDPIDGTKEFIKKNGEFTINLALVEEHTPIAGIVMAPALGELYWAIQGEGAFCERTDRDREQLFVSGRREEEEALRVVCSRSHLDESTKNYIDRLNKPELVQKGGSMKFMDIASGKADLYPRFGPTMEWDTCAPQIVVMESGGSIRKVEGNTPLEYGKKDFYNPYFIVYAYS